MSRGLKFKAWDKKKGAFVFEGTLADIRHASGKLNFTTWDWIEYTGRKDKYGVEIYEGDLVKWTDTFGENPNIFKVAYHEAQWVIIPVTDSIKGWYLGEKELEVIGYINQNPELLQ
jgi:uncharacterized phage protein (TIGR01671 family)